MRATWLFSSPRRAAALPGLGLLRVLAERLIPTLEARLPAARHPIPMPEARPPPVARPPLEAPPPLVARRLAEARRRLVEHPPLGVPRLAEAPPPVVEHLRVEVRRPLVEHLLGAAQPALVELRPAAWRRDRLLAAAAAFPSAVVRNL